MRLVHLPCQAPLPFRGGEGEPGERPFLPAATGPRTPAGKAVSARNATTHGLFCRQAVLPHLGENPDDYETLLRHLFDQVRPRNLMERQYLELWAEASWKLRRLSRFEADVWEDDALARADRLAQLEKLDRLQTSLRRKMDKAVHMLGPDVPRLFAQRTREDLMDHLGLTPTLCASHPYRERDLEDAVRAHRTFPGPPETMGLPDAQDAPSTTAETQAETKNCENEPPAASDTPTRQAEPPTATSLSPRPRGERCPMRADRGSSAPAPENKKHENEPPVGSPSETAPGHPQSPYNSFTAGRRHPSPSGEGTGEPKRAGGGAPTPERDSETPIPVDIPPPMAYNDLNTDRGRQRRVPPPDEEKS